MAQKAKYSEDWRNRAPALQSKTEEAVALVTFSMGDYGWLYQLHSWVVDLAQGKAPDRWSDMDCEISLPREDKRVSSFLPMQMPLCAVQICGFYTRTSLAPIRGKYSYQSRSDTKYRLLRALN